MKPADFISHQQKVTKMHHHRTSTWPLPGTVDPVIADLRRFETEQEQADKEAEQRRRRIEDQFNELRLSRGDFDEAVREGFWGDSAGHAAAHIAYINGDDAEFGRQMRKIIDKELRDQAERNVDE